MSAPPPTPPPPLPTCPPMSSVRPRAPPASCNNRDCCSDCGGKDVGFMMPRPVSNDDNPNSPFGDGQDDCDGSAESDAVKGPAMLEGADAIELDSAAAPPTSDADGDAASTEDECDLPAASPVPRKESECSDPAPLPCEMCSREPGGSRLEIISSGNVEKPLSYRKGTWYTAHAGIQTRVPSVQHLHRLAYNMHSYALVLVLASQRRQPVSCSQAECECHSSRRE